MAASKENGGTKKTHPQLKKIIGQRTLANAPHSGCCSLDIDAAARSSPFLSPLSESVVAGMNLTLPPTDHMMRQRWIEIEISD